MALTVTKSFPITVYSVCVGHLGDVVLVTTDLNTVSSCYPCGPHRLFLDKIPLDNHTLMAQKLFENPC